MFYIRLPPSLTFFLPISFNFYSPYFRLFHFLALPFYSTHLLQISVIFSDGPVQTAQHVHNLALSEASKGYRIDPAWPDAASEQVWPGVTCGENAVV